jgi:hypothetical protein
VDSATALHAVRRGQNLTSSAAQAFGVLNCQKRKFQALGGEMDNVVNTEDDRDGGGLAVDARVRVFPGTDREVHGVVVDDYGQTAGAAVEIGGERIVGPARRWAIMSDDGGLIFADSDQLIVE